MVFKNLTKDGNYKVTRGIYTGWEIKKTTGDEGFSTYVVSSSLKSLTGEGMIEMEFQHPGALTEEAITDHLLAVVANDFVGDGLTSANLDILNAIPAGVFKTAKFKERALEQFMAVSKRTKKDYSEGLEYLCNYADHYKHDATKRVSPSTKPDKTINL